MKYIKIDWPECEKDIITNLEKEGKAFSCKEHSVSFVEEDSFNKIRAFLGV